MSNVSYKSSNNVSFVVKNNSKKKIRIFNYPVWPGQSRDLMKIPGIGEDDVRASLLKGQLQFMISVGQITVIQSDIDLIQFNAAQQTFLQNAGVSSASTDIGVDLGIVSSAQQSIYAAVSNWYLSLSGTATNSGTDALHPITPAEWSRRLKGVNITAAGEVLVTYDAAGDPNGILHITCNIYNGTTLRVTGNATQVLTGTIDTWTAENTATNTGWGITTNAFAAGDWSSHLYQSLRNTTVGARNGIRVFVLGDQNASVPLVAKTCRIPKPYAVNFTYPFSVFSSATPTQFVSGDTYALETLSPIGGISFEGFVDTTGFGTRLIIDSLKIGYSTTFSLGPASIPTYQNSIIYTNCDLGFAGVFSGVNTQIIGCAAIEMFVQYGSNLTMIGGGISTSSSGPAFGLPEIGYGAYMQITDCLFVGGQSQSLEVDDGGLLRLITSPSGFFDFTTGGGVVLVFGLARFRISADFYGTNNALAVQCQDGGKFAYAASSNLKIAATNMVDIDGRFLVWNGVTNTWGNAIYHDRISGSSIQIHASGGGPTVIPYSFSANASLTAASAQLVPPGNALLTITTDLNVGCLAIGNDPSETASGSISNLLVRFTGSVSNAGGQTVTFQVFKSIQGAAPGAVTGAVTTALATTAGTKIQQVVFTPVTYKSGDVITVVLTPSSGLTAPLTDVMVSVF